jgi:FkbH-like protein
MIKSALPEVMVVDLPEDSSLYLKTILQINDFNSLHLTEEDRQKGRMYAQQRGRNEVKKAATDISEYLESLEMKVTIYRDSLRHVPRISQLTLKTNQFNLTTRRFQEESIREFVESDDFLVLCVKVEDRFGDNGVSGVAIVEKGKEAWNIKSFLLSCRIIGRNIEQILLKQIIELAVESAIEKVRGEFILTSKNAPARSFYEQNGFAKVSANGAEESWEFDTRKAFSFPDYIKVIKG